jgi:ubiquinone/menaquinone biosynthesis C-methylase UbiE
MSNVFEQAATINSWDDDYYHPIAERYYDLAVPAMLDLMGTKPGDMVLDAGCGPGVHAVRAVNAGRRVTAVDISKTMLETAAERVMAAGALSSVTFQQEDLTKLSFADASFKYVFSWGVVIHIRDAASALRELARITKPGGSLALYITNNDSFDKKIEDSIRAILRKSLNREPRALGTSVEYDMHGEKLWVWQFDIPAVEREMQRHGLRLTHRVVGEYSEIQRRVGGPIRQGLLHLNNMLYGAKVSPRHASTNLLVFHKT